MPRKAKSKFYKYARHTGNAIQVATKALSTAYAIKKLLNVERKYLSVYNTSTPATTPTIIFLTGSAQGDTQNSRQGNSIKMSSISMKLQFLLNASATTTFIRVILFKDKASNGVVPTHQELLESTDSQPWYIANYNPDNCPTRFKVVSDSTHILEANGNTGKQYSKYFKVNTHVKYDGTGSTQAEATTGHYYLLVVSDEVTNVPTIRNNLTLRYIDN